MSVLATRLRSLVGYMAVMRSPADLYRYARLRAHYRRGGEPRMASIRLRTLGGAAVLCRASQDVHTFKHTFLVGYHLPPVPLAPDATIVDLGSNVGYTVADFAHRYPAARVVGVEMEAKNLELARRNTAPFGDRVTLVHAAVWTEDGVVRYTGDADDAFTVMGAGPVPPEPPAGEADVRTAPAKRLTTIFDEQGVDRVDYLKMDIEGAEGPLLSAALDWTDRVRSMKIEVHPPVSLEQCRRVLEARGFTCWEDDQHPACLCAVRR